MGRFLQKSKSVIGGSVIGLARKFSADQSGGVVMVSALALVVLVLSAGSAVDYARAYQVKSHLAGALDAAVISVARDLRDGRIKKEEAKARAQAFFDMNIRTIPVDLARVDKLTIKYRKKDTNVYVAASATVPTTFMQIAGIKEVPIALDAQVTYSFATRDIEIALVLDVTGSMARSGRITALRAAAADLVDTIIPDDMTNEKVRISIIPYSQGVNAGSYAATVTGGVSTDCATERVGTQQYSDSSPAAEPIGDGSTNCPSNRIRPLILDKAALLSDIANLTTGGYTAGHTGIAWGWYTLSPNWSDIWPTNSLPNPYNEDDKKLLKAAIIMTDGEFNTAYVQRSRRGLSELRGSANSQSEERARALCAGMKADHIRIYSVAFDAGSKAEALLKECATDDATYYEAKNANELKDAFGEIANDIGAFWLSM